MADNHLNESPKKGPTLSTSTSSFEALDPHDPNLSRLATTMFENIQDYLFAEVSVTQDHYKLLEDMNRVAIAKYIDMRQIIGNISQNMGEVNSMCVGLEDMFKEIDEIEVKVNKLEEAAFKLMSHLKLLLARLQSLENRGKNIHI